MEEIVKGPQKFFVLIVFAFITIGSSASDIYIAQNAAGAKNGTDCNDAYAVSFFNSASNWGTAAGQIGPGTTVHLCGTFTAPAGASGYLSFQGSGTTGNQITLLFESGAVLTAPYWGTAGAIYASGNSYITVDGNGSGTISATANGSGLANQQPGYGVLVMCNNGCTVQNLTVSNIYVYSSPSDESSAAGNSFGIYMGAAGGSNFVLHNNTVNNAHWCVMLEQRSTGNTVSNGTISNNTTSSCDHGVVLANSQRGTFSGVTVNNNTTCCAGNWDDTAHGNHHDGMHLWAVVPGATNENLTIYNNYCYGNMGLPSYQNFQACIYVEVDAGSTGTGTQVFNNVAAITPSVSQNGIFTISGTNPVIYNNTIAGPGTTGNGYNNALLNLGNESGACVQNNLFYNTVAGIAVNNDGSNIAATCGGLKGSDHNLINALATSNSLIYQANFYNSFGQWQTGTGFDPNSQSGAPNLVNLASCQSGVISGCQIQSTGSAYQKGQNLYNMITGMNDDAAGNPRPSTGAWGVPIFCQWWRAESPC
jgi:parallel beta-helix repeat protein